VLRHTSLCNLWLQVREKAMANEAEAIWYEFHDRLRAFIARWVDNEADGEDILQNVFLRVHQSLGTLHRADRLASWLYQVTRNAIADYYRAPERRREIPPTLPSRLKLTEMAFMGILQ
jgi:RNA polymerase sigma-70 factor, ECF subfamily